MTTHFLHASEILNKAMPSTKFVSTGLPVPRKGNYRSISLGQTSFIAVRVHIQLSHT